MCLFAAAAPAIATESKDPASQDKPPAKPKKSKGGGWSVSGGIAPGEDYFAAAIGVGYGFTRYLAGDVDLHYESRDQKPFSGTAQGGSVAFIIRAANPTMITPFIGAGPGYEKWHREQDGKQFDDNSSATATGFVGASVRLGGSLSIQIQRRNLRYIQRTPLTWGDHSLHESKSRYANQVGFSVSF
jgi:opacity protein-like surface antigen